MRDCVQNLEVSIRDTPENRHVKTRIQRENAVMLRLPFPRGSFVVLTAFRQYTTGKGFHSGKRLVACFAITHNTGKFSSLGEPAAVCFLFSFH